MSDILTKALEEQDYLMHHGILGQKWGVRRYQNSDGSLTEEGQKRYLKNVKKSNSPLRAQLGTAKKYSDENAKMLSNYFQKNVSVDDFENYAKNANSQFPILDYTRKKMSDATGLPLDDVKPTIQARNAVSKVLSNQLHDAYYMTDRAYSKDGWNVDKSGDFGGDVYATKEGSLGKHKVTISSLVDPKDIGGNEYEHVTACNKAASAISSNASSVIKQSRNLIAKEIYDNDPNLQKSMSRQEFMKSIKPEVVDVYGSGSFSNIANISFSANGMGGHSLDIEWDIKNNRPVRNDVSVNG